VNLAEAKTTTKAPLLSVYGYTDHRRYLFDYYQMRKDALRGYSYRAFSRAAGFSSPNYIKLVVDGQRNLSRQSIEKLVRALGLSAPMAAYFRHLVVMNLAKTDDEKQLHFEAMKRLVPQAKRRELAPGAVAYLSHWIYPVVREMALLPGFNGDPLWISRRINHAVGLNEINDALNFLRREGFLRQVNGRYEAVDNLVISSDEVRSLAVRNYHRQMLGCAVEALDVVAMEEREYGALTTILPKAAIPELKHRLKSFRQELHTWALQVSESERGDTVIQLNFQMFPFSKGGGDQ